MSDLEASRRLRIAIVIEQVHCRGGQERVIAELIRRLAVRHDIEIFCFSATDISADKVKVRRLWCPGDSNTLQALWVPLVSWLVIRPRRYDVVLSQGGNCLVQNFVLAHTCHARRAPAKSPRSSEELKLGGVKCFLLYLRNRWATAMERWAMRRCAGRIISVSPALSRVLAQEYDIPVGEILSARNGVDQETFNPHTRAQWRDQMRQELGLGSDEFVMLFVGGLWFERGLLQALEALKYMKSPGRLLVVGHGDQALFGQMAESWGVRDRVIFLGQCDHIERYYAAADCFAFPSPIEGFALVTMEAAASGLPLVIARLADTEEFFEDGVSAFLLGPDPQEMADRLDRLAQDPELRRRMGHQAHEAVRTLTWEHQAEVIERFLLEKTSFPQPVALSRPQPIPSAGERLRVAVISHSCVVNVNQRLYVQLAQDFPDLELLLITPERWWAHLTGSMDFSVLPGAEEFVHPLPVHWRGQIHLHWYVRRRLQFLLNTFRPQVVLVDEEPYSLAGFQGGRLAHRLSAKLLLYTKQNLLRFYPPPFCWTQSWLLGHANHMLAVSSECETVLRRRGYSGPVTILPHGVDTQVFTPGSSPALRQKLGLTAPVIGYAGRLEQRKGIMDLLEAVHLLCGERGNTFNLLIVGNGPLRRQVERFTARCLAPGQAVHVGYVAHDDMPQYFRAMDVLVLPSLTTPRWKEQFGRVLLEALACGVPAVGSDSGYIPTLIERTGGGLVFREGEARDLADKLAWLLDHSEEAQVMVQRGREVVDREFSLSGTAHLLYQAVRAAARNNT